MIKVRYCPKCKLTLDVNQFHKDNKRKDKLQLWCKSCGLKNKKKNYYSHRAEQVKFSSRKTRLKKDYGLSMEDYHQMLINQGGVCAICGKEETQSSCKNGTIDSLRVDHCHRTKKVRGLLCSKCNFALGHFDDNVILMKNAIKYLKKHHPELWEFEEGEL